MMMAGITAGIGLGAGADARNAQIYQMIPQRRSFAGGHHDAGIGKTQPQGQHHLDKIAIGNQEGPIRRDALRRSKAGKGKGNLRAPIPLHQIGGVLGKCKGFQPPIGQSEQYAQPNPPHAG